MTLEAHDLVRKDLNRLLPIFESEYLKPFEGGEVPRLSESMTYSLKAGGKRIRPALCMLAAESVGAAAESALPCAIALEYIHTYSLIHDDLPAMDNDDLRRGKPTNHIVFGEAQAILAGDGLLTEAFRVLAVAESLDPTYRLDAISVLALASGWRGMVGGQSLDIDGEAMTSQCRPYGLDHLQLIHRLKTGKLIQASLELGAVAAGANAGHREIMKEAGAALGLAFQIQDDILDATSTDESMGKRVGKDQDTGKITYPRLLGLDGSRKALIDATNHAKARLQLLPKPGSLVAWASYLAERSA